MPRFKLVIEYDGTPFSGWQRQAHSPSVQQTLEEAVAILAGRHVTVQGSGRTDSGVHALGQVAHFDIDKPFEARKIRDALNHHVKPNPVAVLEATEVDESFHARFSATARHYVYRIIDRRAELTFDKTLAWRALQPIDADAMHQAAQLLLGYHDFTTFRDSQCQADSPMRTLDEISVTRTGDELRVEVSALSFLHRQVRSIVGSLMEVGRGKQPASWMGDILKAADRTQCGPVAPAAGLYLARIDFD